MNYNNNNKTSTKKLSRNLKLRNRNGKKQRASNALINIVNVSRVPAFSLMKGPFPQDQLVNMHYFSKKVVQGAVSFITIDLRINSIWQPEVGGPTGVLSGYNGSAFRYASYRVENFKLCIRVVSNEPNIGMSFAVIFNDTQPSTTISTYQQALTASVSSASLIRGSVGETTGMSRFVSPTVSIPPSSVVGNPLMYYSDRDFSGSLGTPLVAAPVAGTNPNQAVWGTFILLAESSATNLTNGCFLDWDAEYVTRTYGPLPLC